VNLVGLRGDPNPSDDRRVERIRRALDEKLPKLRAAAEAFALKSILILESNDIALTSVFNVAQAFKQVVSGRADLPGLVFLVETDSVPLHGWLLKDGDRLLPHVPHFEDTCAASDPD
jgi:hypothetical protein